MTWKALTKWPTDHRAFGARARSLLPRLFRLADRRARMFPAAGITAASAPL